MSRQMRALTIIATVAVVTSLLAVQVGARQRRASEPVVLRPDQLTWQARAEGVQVAVLYGDPDQPGPFALRLRYPAGYRKAPHTHPNDAYVTVLEGSYFRGYGSAFDEARGYKLTPGTFSVNPAGVSHYEWTTEPAMLQVQATGPWTTTYVQAGTDR